MPDQKEAIKKIVADLKEKVGKEHAAGKDSKKDPAFRTLRKQLKRAQRKLALITPLSHDQKVVRQAKFVDMITKRLGELTQGAKKIQANPYVRSCKKKLKSLNKLKKRLDRKAKKAAAKAVVKPAPAAAAPAAAAPAPEGEKT